MVAADGGSGPRDRILGAIKAARAPSIRIAREKSSSSASDRHPFLCPQSTPSAPRRFAWAKAIFTRRKKGSDNKYDSRQPSRRNDSGEPQGPRRRGALSQRQGRQRGG